MARLSLERKETTPPSRWGVLFAALATAALTVLLTICFIPRVHGPIETALVTVEKRLHGHSGRHTAAYDFAVVLPDGSERIVRLGQSFPVGTRLRLVYTRSTGKRLSVHSYVPVGTEKQ
jgi:hypothetical protein